MSRIILAASVSLSLLGGVILGNDSRLVRVEIFEDVSPEDPWSGAGEPTANYSQDALAWTQLPNKYLRGGLITDRSNPFVVRATAQVELPAGQGEFLLRVKNVARLWLDGELILEQTIKLAKNADGHEATPDLPGAIRPGHRPPPPAHHELTATVDFPAAGPHELLLETVVGGKGLRAELGELCVAFAASADDDFLVLAPDESAQVSLTTEAWDHWHRAAQAHIREVNTTWRRAAASEDDAYWQKRHELARMYYAQQPPIDVPEVRDDGFVSNAIDHFIIHTLEQESQPVAEVVDDLTFLRRVMLDTTGVIPSVDQIQQFAADTRPDRRAHLVDRLLEDPRWADHWVGYWQDVLAENPNILKASLNNTGPFRWWIHESFLDNKPMDRFATDLILMRGSRYQGGPAGFGLATQNDVPEANKALILSKALLAANMNCARCHDSPVNDFTQKQLFSIAAMLRREALELPESSTVAVAEGARPPAVDVSLKPGDQILPHWPVEELASDELPAGMLRDTADPREWLAAIITSPRNPRFAKVMANRLWHRFTGRGLVNPIDDWDNAPDTTHPELLDYLARELVTNGYDLKHVSRLILNSQTYQRVVLSDDTPERREGEFLFASATRRRLTAEQIFDSLFALAGKDPHAEPLTMDPEGRRPTSTFLNLRIPQRAWQFSSLSNERDRPALSLPVAQSANDLLKAFGWRESRQDPLTERDATITPLQPLVLANGTMGRRLVGLSDDHAVTKLSLYDLPLEALTEQLFLAFFTRRPDNAEKQAVIDMLADGYAQRIVLDAQPIADAYQWQRHPVSWANHLHGKSSEIMLALEQRALEGDPATRRLTQDWRERMEDVLWALANNPEFVFVP